MFREIIFWGLIFVVLAIVEISTVQLVSIWLALSALITMFFAIVEIPFWQQAVIFVVISAVLLAATRPLVKKFITSKKVETNAKLDIGKNALVIEEINVLQSKGRVRLGGVDWTALTEDSSVIPEGEVVIVDKIDGAKLIVHV